jgi:hypothetical protein
VTGLSQIHGGPLLDLDMMPLWRRRHRISSLWQQLLLSARLVWLVDELPEKRLAKEPLKKKQLGRTKPTRPKDNATPRLPRQLPSFDEWLKKKKLGRNESGCQRGTS